MKMFVNMESLSDDLDLFFFVTGSNRLFFSEFNSVFSVSSVAGK